jgi:hypothetical protein
MEPLSRSAKGVKEWSLSSPMALVWPFHIDVNCRHTDILYLDCISIKIRCVYHPWKIRSGRRCACARFAYLHRQSFRIAGWLVRWLIKIGNHEAIRRDHDAVSQCRLSVCCPSSASTYRPYPPPPLLTPASYNDPLSAAGIIGDKIVSVSLLSSHLR